MSIRDNLESIKNNLLENVQLVAVSKTKPVEDIKEAYDSGQRIFGENKAQDMAAKHPLLPNDIQWHFIGHLQSNKVKYIAPFVSLVHSVDSFKILKEINKQGLKCNRVIDCLLQFHIASEDTKFGLDMAEAMELLQSVEFSEMRNIRIVGLMGMATFTDDKNQVKKEFNQLKIYFLELKKTLFEENPEFKEISMGMSDDYHIAMGEGSTLVRIGSSIFGARKTQNSF